MKADIFESLRPELELLNEEQHQLWLEVATVDARALRYTTYCERICAKVASHMQNQDERIMLYQGLLFAEYQKKESQEDENSPTKV